MTDKEDRINKLREHLELLKIKHDDEIMNQDDLKQAHIYCVINKLTAQQYGPILEKFIQKRYNYIKNKAQLCIGDCSKNNFHVEIKVSLGGAANNKFNYVQFRPSHTCHFYILTAYNLSFDNLDNEGEVFIFKVPKNDMITIIHNHGGYAHGTIAKNGKITFDDLNDPSNQKEYAIRPTYNDKCWKDLLPFRIEENEL